MSGLLLCYPKPFIEPLVLKKDVKDKYDNMEDMELGQLFGISYITSYLRQANEI